MSPRRPSSEQALAAIAGAIDAIGQHDFHDRFCDYLATCLAYDNVIAITYHGTLRPEVHYRRTRGPNVFRHVETTYLDGAYVIDPVYQYHLRRKPSGIFRLKEIAPDQFHRSHYYKWYYGQIGIIDEISVIQSVGEDTTITISMGRDSSSNQVFSAQEEKLLRQHEAVILNLARVHWMNGVTAPRRPRGSDSIVDGLIVAMRNRHDIALSRRQAEIALMILQGHSSYSISLVLEISLQTVKVHRKQLYRRCRISSQAELFTLILPLLQQDLGIAPGRGTLLDLSSGQSVTD